MVNSVWVAAVDSGVGAGQGRGVGAAISRVFGGAQLAIAPIRPTSLAPAVCEDLCKPIEPKWLCVCLMLLLLLPARGCPPEAGGCRPARQRLRRRVSTSTCQVRHSSRGRKHSLGSSRPARKCQRRRPPPPRKCGERLDLIRRDANVHRRARGCESKFQVKVLFIF